VIVEADSMTAALHVVERRVNLRLVVVLLSYNSPYLCNFLVVLLCCSFYFVYFTFPCFQS
jgi:hypothetical protein